MNTEIWKPIFGGRYEVSNLGRVRSLYHRHGLRSEPRLLSQHLQKRNGQYIRCTFDKSVRYVHQLVAAAFLGERPIGTEVAHLDGNPLNNQPTNLAYVSRKENNSHRLLHGTDNRGSKNPISKLTEEQVREIRAAPYHSRLAANLSTRFGVGRSTIRKIRTNGSWQHVK